MRSLLLLACLFPLFASEVAPSVTVANPQGRPLLIGAGAVPLPMAGYSPIFWEKARLDRQLPCFAKLPLGFVFTGMPDMRGTEAFWKGDVVVAEPQLREKPGGFSSAEGGALQTVEEIPGARLIVRFGLGETDAWRNAHPDEFVLTENGERLTVPSLASDLYWRMSAEGARALVRWYENQPAERHLAQRIIAYADFWRCEGTHEATIMGWLSDRSPVAVAAFRKYLTEVYQDDSALQRAWGDAKASLATVLPPADRLRGPVREVARIPFWQAGMDNAPLRDWLRCLGALFKTRVGQVAVAMKEGCQGRVPILHDMLKQPMQGWNIVDFFDPAAPTQPFGLELMGACGSRDAAEILALPGVDGLITPHDYQARGLGGIFEPEGAADSCTLRGKLFLCEMDTRSYAGGYQGRDYGWAGDLDAFAAITWRNLATGLTRGWWPYWMDLHADWFADPAMQPLLARQTQVLNEATSWPHTDEPGIAVVVDDRAAEDTNGAARLPNLALAEQLRVGIARCGVPYRVYLLEDLALPNLPKHKVWYFPNLYRTDARRLELVKNVLRDGNVVIWGPGSGISDGAHVRVDSAAQLTGFAFAPLVPGNYQRHGLFIGSHPLVSGISGTAFGDGIGYGPQLWPTDGVSLASAWAQQGKERSALAVKPQAGWTSVFAAALPLPPGFWRNAARLAGAQVWSESDDVLMASRELVALHSVVPGTKLIRLPRAAKVVDLASGEVIATKADEIRFEISKPATRVFRLLPP